MRKMYGTLFRKLLFPVWETTIRNRPTLRYWSHLERTQWAPLAELERLQDEALAELLEHAYDNVPFWRRRFQEAGIGRSDIRRQDELTALAPLRRSEAQAHFEERQSTRPPHASVLKMTSGTTGQPLSFGYDEGSEHWRQAIKLRGYGWAGYRPGDRCIHYWGSLDALYPRSLAKKVKVKADRFARREIYIDSNRRTEQSLARTVATIERVRPSTFVCFTRAGAQLARYIVERNARAWDRINVICGAEKLYEPERHLLERAFGGDVFETYGSREVMLIGAECEAHTGLHLSMENLIVEVLVPEQDGYRRAKPGERGEIAVTDLHNYGAPFIRYLTGDLGVLEEDTPCRCGRSLRRLRSVEGRTNDTLRDAAGNAVDSLFLNVLFSVLADKVRQFQAVQRKNGALELKIVPTAHFDEQTMEGVRRNCAQFLEGIPLETRLVDDIPVEKSGKLRVVVVEQ